MLLIGIDGCDWINDTFEHLLVSQALAEAKPVFNRTVLETDFAGRYGGDEFVIVLPEIPFSGTMAIAERILTNFGNANSYLESALVSGLNPRCCRLTEARSLRRDLLKERRSHLPGERISKNSVKVAI